MSCMSCSDSGVAMPSMIGFWRLPLLKFSNWWTMYCSLCPASLGYCGSVELPSMPWQAPQAAALAWPAVASPGFAAAVSAAGAASAGAAAVLAVAGAVVDLAASCAIAVPAAMAKIRTAAEPSTTGRKPADRKLIHFPSQKLSKAATACRYRRHGQKPSDYPRAFALRSNHAQPSARRALRARRPPHQPVARRYGRRGGVRRPLQRGQVQRAQRAHQPQGPGTHLED